MAWQYESPLATSIWTSTTFGGSSETSATNAGGSTFSAGESYTVTSSGLAYDRVMGTYSTGTSTSYSFAPAVTYSTRSHAFSTLSYFPVASSTLHISNTAAYSLLITSQVSTTYVIRTEILAGTSRTTTAITMEQRYAANHSVSFGYSTAYLGGGSNTTIAIGPNQTLGTYISSVLISSTTSLGSQQINHTEGSSTGTTLSWETSSTSMSPSTATAGQAVSYALFSIGHASSTASGSASGSTTVSLVGLVPTNRVYSYTTTTSTSTASNWTTTTSASFITYPVTGGGTTVTTSSPFTITTSSQVASTITNTTYSTTTCAIPVLMQTIVEVLTDDWVWVGNTFTTTSPLVSDVASSLSVGTHTFVPLFFTSLTPQSRGTWSSSGNAPYTPISYTVTSNRTTGTTSYSSSTFTTTTQSYVLASPTSTADTLSLTGSTRSSTVTYVTSTGTTFSNFPTNTTTASSSFTTPTNTPNTYTSTNTLTWGTTAVGSSGTFQTSLTYTISAAVLFQLTASSRSTSTTSISATTFTGHTTGEFELLSAPWTTNFLLLSTFAPTYTTTSTSATGTLTSTSFTFTVQEPLVRDGFQAGSTLGRSASDSVGTNVTAGIALPMAYPCSSVWPGGPVTPVFANYPTTFGTLVTFADSITAYTGTDTAGASPVAFGTVGSVVESQSTRRTTASLFGGAGWNSTATISAFGPIQLAIHRGTSVDSTGGTTIFTRQWATSRTLTAAPSVVVAMETVPVAIRGTSLFYSGANVSNLVARFPAFPSP